MTINYGTVKRLCLSLFISLVLIVFYIYHEPTKNKSSTVKLEEVLAYLPDHKKHEEIMAIINGKLSETDCFEHYKKNDLRAICYLIKAREARASLIKLSYAKKAKKYVDVCVRNEPQDNYLRMLRAFIYSNLPSRLVDAEIINQDISLANVEGTQ